MKVIIAGGRNYKPNGNDLNKISSILKENNCTEVVCGGCTGADDFGRYIANIYNIPIKYFLPRWGLYGKSAGPIRNGQMAQYADMCILLPGGKGTKSMKQKAIENNIMVVEIK